MAFSVEDFHDLIRLLEQRPEWRAELRRQVLSDEMLALPEIVQRLAEAQERTEQHLAELDGHVAELDRHMAEVDQRLKDLTLAQDRTEQALSKLVVIVGAHGGELLEFRYERRAPAYFSKIARRLKLIDHYRLADLLDDAIADGRLTEEERGAVLAADLVLSGRSQESHSDVYLVAEVSVGIGIEDVARAVQRAGIMAKLGLPALPVVAGESIIPAAEQMARDLGVWRVLDGRAEPPDVLPGRSMGVSER